MKFASIEVPMGGGGRGLKNATATLSHRYVDWAADVVRGGAVDVVGAGGGAVEVFTGKAQI